MRVFVTGATGYVGAAVARELIAHGHDVVGLARSAESAAKLAAAGAEPHRGDLEDFQSLRAGAAMCDAVIHLGFNHDFSKFIENCAHDAKVVEAIGAALAGSNRLFLVTSGTAVLSPGQLSAEDDAAPIGAGAHPRSATEAASARLAAEGVKLAVVRLAPSVHGDGDQGFVRFVANFAGANGTSAYIREGRNRWSAVHRDDAATLYRLALERGDGGVRYHAVAEEGVAFYDIAEALGRDLGLPVESKTGAAAEEHFGWFTSMASLDTPASSSWTRKALGWRPCRSGLLSDIARGIYRAP